MLSVDETRAIEREGKSLYDRHVEQLLAAGNRINEYEPQRPSSVGEVYESFLADTAAALESYGNCVVERIMYVTKTIRTTIDGEERDAVLACATKYIDENLYLKRRQIFEESLERHLSRYGQQLDSNAQRFDLLRARYDAALVNATRRIVQRLRHELDLLVLRKRQREQQVQVSKDQGRLSANPKWWHNFDRRIAVLGLIVAVLGVAASLGLLRT